MLDEGSGSLSEQITEESKLVRLLEKQYGFYCVILELTRNEHKMFSSKRSLEEIIPIMKKKKILLSCVDEIEEKVISIKERVREENFPSLGGEKEKELVFLIKELLKEMLALDEKNQKALCRYVEVLEKEREKFLKEGEKK